MLRILTMAMVVFGFAASVPAAVQFSHGDLQFTLSNGVITSIVDGDGTVVARADTPADLGCLRLLGKDVPAWGEEIADATVELPFEASYGQTTDDGPTELKTRFSGGEDGALVVEQTGSAEAGSLHGIQWGIAGIPLDYDIIVPGSSGVKLDRDGPGNYFNYDYPIGWEAQFVIIAGKDGGVWVRADDAQGRYKNLRIWKRADCWNIAFGTQNNAPFEDKTAIEGVSWRLEAYEGSWQVPAGKYRAWAEEAFGLTKLADQQPAWVKDMRTLVLCGMDLGLLDVMAEELDPLQTILYVPNWRRDGYDRNYPDYTALPELKPFMEKAHDLGFRVMLHVNYFGVDPKNELYDQFEPYQTREAFSKEKLWWEWPPPHRRTGPEPDIKFAYINPAHKPWRDLFVSRMKALCDEYDVDALHLDQTLCIWNHAGGLIDGMTMIEGSIAEHRDLREALPQVALSGEGLNEVTFRYEAFAQRHATGLNHSEGTWDRNWLLRSHAISSSIFRPYTIINGYLGMSSPTSGQIYPAWMQAYTNWGVIPTFAWPSEQTLREPTGFARQLMDEISFFQAHRLDPDVDSEWPEDTLFAYRGADGTVARYVAEGGFSLVEDSEPPQVISRTLTGIREYTGPGTIGGWRAYDKDRVFGLHPETWYALLDTPKDPDAFHVTSVPEGMRPSQIVVSDDLALVKVEDLDSIVAWAADALRKGRCGYTVFGGDGDEVDGPLYNSDAGASVQPVTQDFISLHPPWKGTRKNPETGVLEAAGTGQVYALFPVDLPVDGQTRFLGEVFMDKGAIGEGKTDGVTFSVEAQAGDQRARAQVHATAVEPVPLELDLTPFAGRTVMIRLAADPGPAKSATFDWARWKGARIERKRSVRGTVGLVSPVSWPTAIATHEPPTVREVAADTYEVETVFPGTVHFLRREPVLTSLPTDLTEVPFSHAFLSHQGTVLDAPQYAAANVAETVVGGVSRPGFFTHPPNRGRTCMLFPVQLPAEPAELRSFIGLRDGSESEGVLFIVEAGGVELARESVMPGEWQTITADLSPWAGKTVVLALITDSDTTFHFDWGAWGEPRIEAAQ